MASICLALNVLMETRFTPSYIIVDIHQVIEIWLIIVTCMPMLVTISQKSAPMDPVDNKSAIFLVYKAKPCT